MYAELLQVQGNAARQQRVTTALEELEKKLDAVIQERLQYEQRRGTIDIITPEQAAAEAARRHALELLAKLKAIAEAQRQALG